MNRGCRLTLMTLVLAVSLLAQVLPAQPKVAAVSAKTLPEIYQFDRKLCPVCRKQEAISRKVEEMFPGQFVVRTFYIDEKPALFSRYRIDIVPTQVFVDTSGKEVFRHEGIFPQEQLIQTLKNLKFIQEEKK
jgi:thioredoxin 1